MNQRKLTSTEKGRHAELIAQTALLANGFTVMEPIAPEAFDLAVIDPIDGRTLYGQVKTASVRNEPRYGDGDYLVVKGKNSSGRVYAKSDVDFFIAVHDGKAYMFDNREKGEYWCKADQVSNRWTLLNADLGDVKLTAAI